MLIEFCCVQGFITDNDKALEELFSESAEGSHKYNACLNTMATRIATVFASMRVVLLLSAIYSLIPAYLLDFYWCISALLLG